MDTLPPTKAASGDKPALRADARRNREKIIQGAREVFARNGASAQMEDIARASGVGVGTVYRHFPTKEALMTEIVRHTFQTFIDSSYRALDGDGEPLELLTEVLRENCEMIARDSAVQYVLTGAGEEVWEGIEPERDELSAVTRRFIEGAQRDGTVRADVDPEDISMLMCGICATMGHKSKKFDWRRHLELGIDSLRAR